MLYKNDEMWLKTSEHACFPPSDDFRGVCVFQNVLYAAARGIAPHFIILVVDPIARTRDGVGFEDNFS